MPFQSTIRQRASEKKEAIKDSLRSKRRSCPPFSNFGLASEAKTIASAIAMKPSTEATDALEKGVMMTKISENGKQKHVEFRLDADAGQILYKSSQKGVVPIECIKEMRMGSEGRYYRAQFDLSEEMEQRWITIVYIVDGTYRTLHFVADTRDVYQQWNLALKRLYAIRQGLMTGLGNTDVRQSVWERQYWKGADDGDQQLSFQEVEKLCLRLNANIPTAELQKLYSAADSHSKGHLNFSDFQNFVKALKRRPDLEGIYGRLCSQHGGRFDVSTFIAFMKSIQKSSLDDTELKALFAQYGPSESTASANEPSNLWTIDHFANFLQSPDNSAFTERKRGIWHDMTYPISDYFISSSHNTYLVGNQLMGVSTIEGYIRALLHSCRSVELDIYDGDHEPVIYHGKTLTSKVPLRDICQAIAKYAFVTSPYPVLISAEVHCGVEQQDKIVDVMVETLGTGLVQAPVEGSTSISQLPSPDDLKYKYLLKAKNLYVVEQLASQLAGRLADKQATLEAETPSSTSSDNEAETKIKEGMADLKTRWKKLRGKEPGSKPHKAKMSFRLASLLVYTVGIKFHGISPEVAYKPEHIFSLSENAATRVMKAGMTDLVKHTHTNLVRVYPKGTRVNSSNYEPHRFWAAGCQVVAINWQTFDFGYMLNQAMFQRNGKAGYVLKPAALRNPGKNLLSKRTQHFLDVTIISAQQLPRLRDSKGREIIEKSIVDPFVEVSLHIPDWSHSPFLPESATAAGAKYQPSSDASTTQVSSARTVSFRTRVIKNNGFNPVWQEELNLPFDCVGDMKDLIFVKFTVRQQGKDDSDDEPIGVYCVPLGCLEQGFRHLPLHDNQLTQHLFATLFVQISVRDIQ